MRKGLQVLLLAFLFLAVCKPMNAEAAGEAVKITGQPQDVLVTEGATASTTVRAEGEGLKYQWYYTSNGTAGGTFYKSSITNATYSTVMNTGRAGRRVYCVITDKYGNKVKSDIAILNMEGMVNTVKITGQPTDVTVETGATASATVKATGDDLKYQWYYTSNGSGNIFYKSSTTKATYSTVMNAERAGRKIYCVVTDRYGNTVKSNTATLNMKGNNQPLKIVSHPQSVTVAEGALAVATVEATGDGLKYQWYYTSNGSDNTFYKSSTTGATYSVVMNSSRAGRKIYCVVTDLYGNTAKTETITLNMLQPLAITKQPKDYAVTKEYELATFQVEVSGGTAPYTYSWEWKDNRIGNVFRKVSSDYYTEGEKTATLSTKVKVIDVKWAKTYRCIVTDATGVQVISEPAMPVYGDRLEIITQPKTVYANPGEKATFTVESRGGMGDISYKWEMRSRWQESFIEVYYYWDEESYYQGARTNSFSLMNVALSLESDVIYRCRIEDQIGNIIYSNEVKVKKPLSILEHPTNKAVRPEQQTELTVKAQDGSGNYLYQWQYTRPGMNEYRNIGASDTWAVGYNQNVIKITPTSFMILNDYTFRCIVTDSDSATVYSNPAKFLWAR